MKNEGVIFKRKKLFVNEYLELRKTMPHNKAIHAIKDKYLFSYVSIHNSIPKDIIAHFETTRPMIRKSDQKKELQ